MKDVLVGIVVIVVALLLLKGCNDSSRRKQLGDCLKGNHNWSNSYRPELYDDKVCDFTYCLCGAREYTPLKKCPTCERDQ